MLGARLLLQSYQNPNLSEGADSVGGQLRGDKDQCPFSGVTKSGRVWRKVPESEVRSMGDKENLVSEETAVAMVDSTLFCLHVQRSWRTANSQILG